MKSHSSFSCRRELQFILSILLAGLVSLGVKADPGPRLIFIGDAGEINPRSKSLLDQASALMEDGSDNYVIFLGDNIYPKGLPEYGAKSRAEAEKILMHQVDPFIEKNAELIFLPGNHDWKRGRKKGYQQILRQGRFLDSIQAGKVRMSPADACLGPEVMLLKNDLVLILIDTQWLLHRNYRPNEDSDCEIKTGIDLYARLEGLLKEHRDRKVIICGHHPLKSLGEHGGRSNLKHHIFPFTDLNKSLYIPLPIIGSIYPFFRKYVGSIQDLSHPAYRVVRKSLEELIMQFPNTTYVSGHDHSLQYLKENETHFLVSGSGSKKTYVKKAEDGDFTLSELGLSLMEVSEDGLVNLEIHSLDESDKLVRVFSKELYSKPPAQDYSDKKRDPLPLTLKRPASNQYLTGDFKKWLLGANYREVWAEPLDFKVFDIAKEKGGLKIVQRGGGMQTKSLRLQAEDGRQYVLRSINKDPAKAIPRVLRGSIAEDVVQDQISAAHPYGAFVVPGLAEKAGIYHTNPQPVLIPQDPLFGKYQDDFSGLLALYEERPAGNWKGTGMFGDSKKIINTTKVLKGIWGDNDNFVDQEFVLRNRLFDLWIGDWDRHDDQWRWASFKSEYGKMYRPIPRDRDQAFFVNQGVLPRLASRKWAMPKFQGFDYELKNVPGFMFNARWFDRSFLNGLERDSWEKIAEDLQSRFPDDFIEQEVKKWPNEVYKHSGEEVSNKLKARKAKWKEYALKHYEFLAKEVDVVGSSKRELFQIERLPNGNTDVKVFKVSKKGNVKQKIFDREFVHKETKEIRLFGLEGKDRFEFKGEAKKGHKIRIIGGEGEDEFENKANVIGLSKRTLLYDSKNGIKVDGRKDLRNHSSNKPDVNEYDRNAFKYDLALPLAFAAFNVDDGIYIGGGALVNTNGFRKDPFKNRHLIRGLLAFRTGAFDIRYNGTFNHFFKSLDLVVNANLEGPNYTRNYFGFGNESVYDRSNSIRYYYVRFDNFIGGAQVQKRLGDFVSIRAGGLYESIEVRNEEDRFIRDLTDSLGNTAIFNQKQFAGADLAIEVDNRDSELFPTSGIRFTLSGKSMQPIDDQAFYYSRLAGEFSFYLNFRSPRTIVLSNRTGGVITDGDIEFYQAATLGGTGKEANLRGYRRTRFYGEESFYNNTDFRFTLFGFKTYLFPAKVGFLGFYDIGRVWVEGENSEKWHQGYGFGLWIRPFEAMTFDLDLAYGESWIPSFRFGFLF